MIMFNSKIYKHTIKMKTIYKLLLSFIWLLSNTVSAQVVYTDLIPDSTISVIINPSSSGYYYLNLDNDALSDFSLQHFVPDTASFKALELRFYGDNPSAQPQGEVLLDSLSFPRKIGMGELIGSASSHLWGNGTNASSNSQWLNDGSGGGNWHGGEEGYLGLRIKKSGQWHYGWVRFYILPGERGFEVKDYAYNKTPNASINAGQKFTTGIGNIGDENENSISIYPNPFRYSTTIKFQETINNLEINIFNLYGQKMKTLTQISGDIVTLEKGNLASGLYFYQINQDNKSMATGTLIITE